MPCMTCERRRQAAFYNRYVAKAGHASVTLLISSAYFAGLRFSARGVRSSWEEATTTLTIARADGALSVTIIKSAMNVTLSIQGTKHQIVNPEDAGFIVQGRQIPIS